jgi:endonuclease/exonuclease/phosphatase family metal-dependent hydrolase
MRVMTWNVFWRWGDHYKERAPGIAELVRAYRPDLLGLSETWAGEGTSQPALLAGEMEGHSAFARTSLPPPPDGPFEMGVGLVSRWPILDTEVHDLPHDLRGGEAPTALVATVDHPRRPLHVIVTCLEWEPSFAGDQLAQASAVAALAARFDGPVLVLGDLNGTVASAELAPLMSTMFDTFDAGGGDPGATTLDSAVPFAPLEATHLLDRRIDHILARPAISVTGAFIAGDRPIGGYYPSDHYAVGVDLEP